MNTKTIKPHKSVLPFLTQQPESVIMEYLSRTSHTRNNALTTLAVINKTSHHVPDLDPPEKTATVS